jgi:hypothetical protein
MHVCVHALQVLCANGVEDVDIQIGQGFPVQISDVIMFS